MDVVEAIDAWIDEQIDDLSDEELETILEILDVVSASRFAELDISTIYDDDIDALIAMVGGSADSQSYTESVLVDALFADADSGYSDANDIDEPVSTARTFAADAGENDAAATTDGAMTLDADDTDHTGIDAPDSAALTLDKDANEDEDDAADSAALPLDADDTNGAMTLDADHTDDTDDTDIDEPDSAALTAGAMTLDADDIDDAAFLSDLAAAEGAHPLLGDATAELAPGLRGRGAPKVALRPFDDLGPSFLPESGASAPKRRRGLTQGLRRVLLPVIMIVCLATFAYGMVELLESLSSDDQQVASTDTSEAPTEEPSAEPVASAVPTAIPATAAPVDPSAPTPTPTPEPTPPPRVAIRLVNGDVMLATWPQVGALAELTTLYDASDDELSRARDIAWLGTNLGVIDNDGNVLVIDPDARRPEPTIIYDVGGGIEAAVQAVAVQNLVAIRTAAGDIILTPNGERADPDVLLIVWDAEDEGIEATDISSVGDLVPFVLEDGDARMIVTSSDNSIVTIWLATDQPPAFNVSASSKGILLGVGQGAVARYRLGDIEGDRLESVWDPFSTDEEPAIGYSSAGDRTAIVLGDGAIVLADDTGTGARVWDPAETEIRAFSASGNSAQVVVLLETGSVVRIPLLPGELIESVWDITDETLNPANQIAVEPARE